MGHFAVSNVADAHIGVQQALRLGQVIDKRGAAGYMFVGAVMRARCVHRLEFFGALGLFVHLYGVAPLCE